MGIPTLYTRGAVALGLLLAAAGSARVDTHGRWPILATSLARGALAADTVPVAASDSAPDPALDYAGHDAHHRPRYVQRQFSDDERALLQRAFGITDPNRLWLPDSMPTSVLRYDATEGGLAARVGYLAWRRPGETWEAFVVRLRGLPRSEWPALARRVNHTGLGVLEPTVRAIFTELLTDARAAGFRVHLIETARAPERQAYLLAHGNGRTLTATSAHVYGRAADIVVDDGNIRRASTRRQWIAFRRWVVARGAGRFRLIGTTSDTWDWPHVELVEPPVGFRSVDELLAAARTCLALSATGDDDPCALPRADSARTAMLADARRLAALLPTSHTPHGSR